MLLKQTFPNMSPLELTDDHDETPEDQPGEYFIGL